MKWQSWAECVFKDDAFSCRILLGSYWNCPHPDNSWRFLTCNSLGRSKYLSLAAHLLFPLWLLKSSGLPTSWGHYGPPWWPPGHKVIFLMWAIWPRGYCPSPLLWQTLGVQGIPSADTSFVSCQSHRVSLLDFSGGIQTPPTKSHPAFGDLDQVRGPSEAPFPRLEVRGKCLTPSSGVCWCQGGRALVSGSPALGWMALTYNSLVLYSLSS